MKFAKLIKGKTYTVLGHVFKLGQERSVTKETYEYLEENKAFELREEKKATPKKKQEKKEEPKKDKE